MWWICIIVVILILALVLLAKRDKKYFESRGITYQGNGIYSIILSFLKGIPVSDNILNQYEKMRSKQCKLIGTNDFGQYALIVLDLDLIKQILVKDFDHFIDRRQVELPHNDFLFHKMLFGRKGDSWKSLRSKLSPTFTTGKIKRMFKIFDESSKKLVQFLEQEMQKSDQVDLTEGYSKFTLDVIASAVCGIKSNVFEQPDSLFEQMGTQLQFKFNLKSILKFSVIGISTKLADFFGLSVLGLDVQHFFSSVIKSSISQRIEKGEIRDDFIQLMLEAREGHLKVDEGDLGKFEKDAVIIREKSEKTNEKESNNEALLDDDSIVANCVMFMIAGFDTTQTLLLFTAYSLATHPQVQDKLRDEIESVLENYGDEFSYEAVNKMIYLDMVINETLRLYPPAVITNRCCTKDYKIPGTEFILKKGEGITIPIYGIHHDYHYYPEPRKFLPERFSSENKSNLPSPYAFLPFGSGPRNCIGMRFALMEVKLAIAHLVKNFTIEPSTKTLIPMKFQNASTLKPVGGMWLALHKRL